MTREATQKAKRKTLNAKRVLSFMFCVLSFALPCAVLAATSPVANEDQFLLDTLWDSYLSQPERHRTKIGLALGGGGARGLAHIGVLKVLEQEGIRIDRLSGISVGALIGALYASGSSTQDLEEMARDIGWSSLTNFSRLNVLRLMVARTLLSTDRMETYLQERMGDKRFDELQIPFVCSATDLQTGERVVFREGPVALAARASATIPGLFAPVSFRHRLLVDGGLVSNVPTDLVKSLGADLVIASDVSSDFPTVETNSVLSIMTQALYIQGQQIRRSDLSRADLIITADLPDISPIDLSRTLESMDGGTRAARLAMPAVKRRLIDQFREPIMAPHKKRAS